MSLSSYLGSYFYDTDSLTVANIQAMRNTSMSNILWDGCFDALHRYNSLRCLVTPIFLSIDQFLYRFSTYWPKTKKFWTLEINKSFFFHHRAVENFDHRSHPVFANKKGFWLFSAWKKVFDYNNLLSGSMANWISSQPLPSSVERLSFFSKSKWTRRRLHSPNLVI